MTSDSLHSSRIPTEAMEDWEIMLEQMIRSAVEQSAVVPEGPNV